MAIRKCISIVMFDWVGPVRIGLIALSAITLTASVEPLVSLLRFEASLVQAGEWWRPLTAWIAQLNVRHWLLNQWGLVVLWLLLPNRMSRLKAAGFVGIWILSSVLLWRSNYDNYVGLSGLLYGWLVYAAALSPFYSIRMRALFIGIVSAKVLWENFGVALSQDDWVGRFIDAQVAHESHFWGWSSGVIAIFILLAAQRFPSKPAPLD